MEEFTGMVEDLAMHPRLGVFKRMAILFQGKMQPLLAQSMCGGGVTRYVLVLAGIFITTLVRVLVKKSSGLKRAHLH